MLGRLFLCSNNASCNIWWVWIGPVKWYNSSWCSAKQSCSIIWSEPKHVNMSNVVFLYTNSDELWAVIQCQSASALQSVLTFLITPWLFPKPVSLQEAVWPLQQHFRCMTTIIVFMNVTKILFDICLTEITVLHVIRDAHLLSFTDNWFWTGQCGGAVFSTAGS